MPKKTRDHKPFLEVAESLASQSRKNKEKFGPYSVDRLTSREVKIIIDHGKWLKGYIADKRKASASRKTFGPAQKPDDQVTAGALYRRKRRAEGKT